MLKDMLLYVCMFKTSLRRGDFGVRALSLGAAAFTSAMRMRDILRCVVLEATNTRERRIAVRPPFECTYFIVVLHHVDRRSLEILECIRHFVTTRGPLITGLPIELRTIELLDQRDAIDFSN
jgi:hypothetical protein